MATELSAKLLEGFTLAYLHRNYDDPKPIPEFHRTSWALYCDRSKRKCAIAAPRGHAKTTALTQAYVLASVLFRVEDYVIVIGSTEDLAIEHLGDISRELAENEDLIRDFNISGFSVFSKTDIVVKFKDGKEFRIICRGSGQKMRGRKWHGHRPGLIVGDDLEDDEQVESLDRRLKFRRWFFRAVIPALSRRGHIRVHGTILADDSLLDRLMRDKRWDTLLFKAHKSFDDFSEVLWPEQYSEEDLRSIRQGFIDQFDSAGYSSEYLNSPMDSNELYLSKSQFIGMGDEDFRQQMKICVGVDFAVSKKDKANRTALVVGGVTIHNVLNFIGVDVGRWDSLEIIKHMFDIQEQYEPLYFFVEDGVIWKTMQPILNVEMQRRNLFLNCIALPSVKDKATRGRSWQKRMKAFACRFDKEAEWYAGFEDECLRFTGITDAIADDQFDGASILSRGFDMLPDIDEEDIMNEDEYEAYRHRREPAQQGRSALTGY